MISEGAGSFFIIIGCLVMVTSHVLMVMSHEVMEISHVLSLQVRVRELPGVGPEEIKKKFFEALLQEKIKRHSHGKNKFIFNSSSAPPQIVNGRPLNIFCSTFLLDVYWSNGQTGDYLTLGMFVYTVSRTF